jgi:hypothetical protein
VNLQRGRKGVLAFLTGCWRTARSTGLYLAAVLELLGYGRPQAMWVAMTVAVLFDCALDLWNHHTDGAFRQSRGRAERNYITIHDAIPNGC